MAHPTRVDALSVHPPDPGRFHPRPRLPVLACTPGGTPSLWPRGWSIWSSPSARGRRSKIFSSLAVGSRGLIRTLRTTWTAISSSSSLLLLPPSLFSSFFSKKENNTVRTVRHGGQEVLYVRVTCGRCFFHAGPAASRAVRGPPIGTLLTPRSVSYRLSIHSSLREMRLLRPRV